MNVKLPDAADPSIFQRGYVKTPEGIRQETDNELRTRTQDGDQVTPNPRN
jgi:hypothetical protein